MARQRCHRRGRRYRSDEVPNIGDAPAGFTSDFPPTPQRRSRIYPPEHYPEFIPDIGDPPIPSLLGPMADVAQNINSLRAELRRVYDNLTFGQNFTNHQVAELRAAVLHLANRVDRLGDVVDNMYFRQDQQEYYYRVRLGPQNGDHESVSTGEPGPEVETIYSDAENGAPAVANPTGPQTFTNGNVNGVNGVNVPNEFVALPNFTFPPNNPQNDPQNMPGNPSQDIDGIVEALNAEGNNSKSSGKDDEWMLPGEKLNGGVNEDWKDENSNVSFGKVDEGTGAVSAGSVGGEGEGSTTKEKVVDAEALKADLMYSVGECAGMLKTFGRLATGAGGVKSAMDAAGRDMYRALRDLEKNMEAARHYKGERKL